MPVLRFHLLTIDHEMWYGGFTVTITTNAACHLYLRYSDVFPRIHRKSVLRRGLVMGWDARYCFAAYQHLEQDEEGDTFTHTFTWPGWKNCETRYFYFWGTMGAQDMVSDAPIFWMHYLWEVLPPLDPSIYYCSDQPADLAVDGFLAGECPYQTWPGIRAHPGDHKDDIGLGVIVQVRVAAFMLPGNHYQLYRGITCFNMTDAVGHSVFNATLYVMAKFKADNHSKKPAINIFSAAPANHGLLAIGDYDSLGLTPLSTPIGYDDWIPDAEHAFPLNSAGLSYINGILAGDGLLALGWRESRYEATGVDPFPGVQSKIANLAFWASEGGGPKIPRLELNQ